MKKQKLIGRKRIKARNRRKDFIKKRNIRKNNMSTSRRKEIVPVIQPIRNIDGQIEFKKGKSQYQITGEKTIIIKMNKKLLSPGDGILPKNKKFKNKKHEKTS